MQKNYVLLRENVPENKETQKGQQMDKLSEHADAIWGLLWEYIANENADESYSEEMAERLCEVILPQVWDYVLRLDKQADEVTQLEAKISAIKAFNVKPEASVATLGDVIMELQIQNHELATEVAQLEEENEGLRKENIKAINLFIGWLMLDDDMDTVIHTDRWLRDKCNCENELSPCKICYALEAGGE